MIDAALKQAKAGNVKEIEGPEIRATRDLLPATAAVTNALLNGDVTPREAAAAARVIKAHGDLIERVDFEPRLLELKAQIERQRGERR